MIALASSPCCLHRFRLAPRLELPIPPCAFAVASSSLDVGKDIVVVNRQDEVTAGGRKRGVTGSGDAAVGRMTNQADGPIRLWNS